MGFKQRIFDLATSVLLKGIRAWGGDHSFRMLSLLREKVDPILLIPTRFGSLRFFCPGELPEWRARTLFTKEPETIQWIHGFSQGDLFWDIGANVGIYSLYAAHKGHQVMAFEPSSPNFFVLNRNILLNKLDERLTAFCLAFSDQTATGSFHLSSFEFGGALNSFGAPLDFKGKRFAPAQKQGMISFQIDEFLERFATPVPTHIKIDVDGIEDRIIAGASKTLSHPGLKSVLIELDIDQREYCARVTENLNKAGLRLVKREHSTMFDTGEFASIYNHIFARNENACKKS